jgi:hypothetical protein
MRFLVPNRRGFTDCEFSEFFNIEGKAAAAVAPNRRYGAPRKRKDWPHSKTLRDLAAWLSIRQVLECASPLAL